MLDLVDADGVVLGNAVQVLSRSHQRVTRVSLLDSLFNPLPGLVFTGDSGYAIDGTVTQDITQTVRRTMSITIANPGGVWTPDGEESAFYWDKHLRIERGVRVGGVEYLAPAGVFLIDAPEVTGNTLRISGADRMDRATKSEFTLPSSYATGQRVGTVIQSILTSAGVGNDFWTIDDDGATLGTARSFEQADERLAAALTLADDFSLEVFADAAGFMVVRPKQDPRDAPIVWTFQEGADATHLGLSKRWSRDRFYNHILVSGEGADTSKALIRAETSVTNPSSPLRVTGPMGDRLYKYTSAMITTQAQADKVAASLLWRRAIIEEEIRLDHVPNPTIEVGDAVRIVDTNTHTDSRYLISSLNLPLAGGPATLDVKKIRRLS
ncbi:MAG: DUF5047 domain-containing protein [Gemmatimonadaceae bacterium]|nr:DUF5047 domain-containing protein [Gemmatimonadaceae bacterium]